MTGSRGRWLQVSALAAALQPAPAAGQSPGPVHATAASGNRCRDAMWTYTLGMAGLMAVSGALAGWRTAEDSDVPAGRWIAFGAGIGAAVGAPLGLVFGWASGACDEDQDDRDLRDTFGAAAPADFTVFPFDPGFDPIQTAHSFAVRRDDPLASAAYDLPDPARQGTAPQATASRERRR